MPVFEEEPEQGAGNLQSLLRGLVGICICSYRDGLRHVAGLFPRREQPFCRIGLEIDLRLEVDAGGEIEITMAGSGVTVRAAVLAALVGVDRSIERYIR